MYKIITKIF